jgi:hypothetical protein
MNDAQKFMQSKSQVKEDQKKKQSPLVFFESRQKSLFEIDTYVKWKKV